MRSYGMDRWTLEWIHLAVGLAVIELLGSSMQDAYLHW